MTFSKKKQGLSNSSYTGDNAEDRDNLDILLTGITSTELLRHLERLERKIMKLELVIDNSYFKAGASHALLVVRKIGEDKLDQLEEILD